MVKIVLVAAGSTCVCIVLCGVGLWVFGCWAISRAER